MLWRDSEATTYIPTGIWMPKISLEALKIDNRQF